jgi:hypothetical protein
MQMFKPFEQGFINPTKIPDLKRLYEMLKMEGLDIELDQYLGEVINYYYPKWGDCTLTTAEFMMAIILALVEAQKVRRAKLVKSIEK